VAGVSASLHPASKRGITSSGVFLSVAVQDVSFDMAKTFVPDAVETN